MTTEEKKELHHYAVEQIIDQFREVNETAKEVAEILNKYKNGNYNGDIASSIEVKSFLSSVAELELEFENLQVAEEELESDGDDDVDATWEELDD